MNGDANAIRKLAAWQGGVDATVKSIVKNQDELERRVQALWASHSECREQTLTALTTLETTAKLEARKWLSLIHI